MPLWSKPLKARSAALPTVDGTPSSSDPPTRSARDGQPPISATATASSADMTTPGLPTPPKPCRTCATPTTNQGQRCNTCKPKHTHTHNQAHAYYSSNEWRALRQMCRQRDYNQCVCCAASSVRLMAHHIIPRKRGGPDSLDNLVTLCHRCHSKIEAGDQHTSSALRQHLAIRPNQ